MKAIVKLSALILISGLSACSTVEEVMQTDRDMRDVIFGDISGVELARDRIGRDMSPDLVGYTRTADNEHQVLFTELPNPRLQMYVHPHLTADSTPIPGYSVPLYFYDQPVYALPGEAYGWE